MPAARMTSPRNSLTRADAQSLRQRAHDMCVAANAKGADAGHTFALSKSAYNRIDADPEHGEQILSVLGKSLDAVTSPISFVRPVAKAGVSQAVNADQFWTATIDGSVTTYRFNVAAWLAACAAAGDGTVGMFGAR